MEISAEFICLIAGPIIAGLVSLFKGWSFVAKHPKGMAMILSVLTAVVSGLSFGDLDWTMIATCVLVPFSAAVATYEVAKSVTDTTPSDGSRTL